MDWLDKGKTTESIVSKVIENISTKLWIDRDILETLKRVFSILDDAEAGYWDLTEEQILEIVEKEIKEFVVENKQVVEEIVVQEESTQNTQEQKKQAEDLPDLTKETVRDIFIWQKYYSALDFIDSRKQGKYNWDYEPYASSVISLISKYTWNKVSSIRAFGIKKIKVFVEEIWLISIENAIKEKLIDKWIKTKNDLIEYWWDRLKKDIIHKGLSFYDMLIYLTWAKKIKTIDDIYLWKIAELLWLPEWEETKPDNTQVQVQEEQQLTKEQRNEESKNNLRRRIEQQKQELEEKEEINPIQNVKNILRENNCNNRLDLFILRKNKAKWCDLSPFKSFVSIYYHLTGERKVNLDMIKVKEFHDVADMLRFPNFARQLWPLMSEDLISWENYLKDFWKKEIYVNEKLENGIMNWLDLVRIVLWNSNIRTLNESYLKSFFSLLNRLDLVDYINSKQKVEDTKWQEKKEENTQ